MASRIARVISMGLAGTAQLPFALPHRRICAARGRAGFGPCTLTVGRLSGGRFLPPSAAASTGAALASMLIYVVMAVILALRPQGLFPAGS